MVDANFVISRCPGGGSNNALRVVNKYKI